GSVASSRPGSLAAVPVAGAADVATNDATDVAAGGVNTPRPRVNAIMSAPAAAPARNGKARRPAGGPARLEREAPRADADLLDLGAGDVGEREQQVRRRLLVVRSDVAVALDLAVRAAEHDGRGVVAVVRVPVRHAAAPVDQRRIEQRAVAVGRGLQLADELGELLALVRRELRVALDVLGLVAVVRD